MHYLRFIYIPIPLSNESYLGLFVNPTVDLERKSELAAQHVRIRKYERHRELPPKLALRQPVHLFTFWRIEAILHHPWLVGLEDLNIR